MTALVSRPARLRQDTVPAVESTRDWVRAAACRFDRSDVDLTEITDSAFTEAQRNDGAYRVETRAGTALRDYDTDVAAARALCASCPVLAACRATALSGEPLAGFVAGMTEAERDLERVGRSTRRRTQLVDVTASRDLTAALIAEADWVDQVEAGVRLKRGALSDRQFRAVASLSRAGLTAAEVASRVGVAETTVDYVRQVMAGSKTRGTR